MRTPSQSPRAIKAREQRALARAKRLASGWRDGRYKHPEDADPAIYLRTWRARHPEMARLQCRVYTSMHRSYIWREAWPLIVAHYGGRCLNPGCRKPGAAVCCDHVVPLSGGGTNDIENIVPSCVKCNSSKHDDGLIQFLLRRVA